MRRPVYLESLTELILGLVLALILGVLALIWMAVRAVLTFLTGMSFLAAVVGLGGWVLTHDTNLWGMFWKSAIACVVVGLLLSGALLPLVLPVAAHNDKRPDTLNRRAARH
jgi:hypothetical protein